MGLFRFLKKHLAPFWIVVGGALLIYGYASEGLELYRLGLPLWVWQIVGVGLVIVGLLVFVHRNERASPANAVAEPRSEEAKKRSEMASAHFQITGAHGQARMALAGHKRDVSSTVATVESALATVRRVYRVGTPSPTGDDHKDLQTWVDYLDVVWPFLQHRNIEMARVKAIKFLGDRGLEADTGPSR